MSRTKSSAQATLDWKATGRRVRELRGFDAKQSEIAEAIGLAQSQISDIEHGRREIGAFALYRIATYYGKTMEWILTGKDPGSC